MEQEQQLLSQSKSLGLSDSSEDTQFASSAVDADLIDLENQLMNTLRQTGEEFDKKIKQYDFRIIVLWISFVIQPIFTCSTLGGASFFTGIYVCLLAGKLKKINGQIFMKLRR